jgi:RNA polymerase sigma factor (sigma-70 family)
MQSLFSQPIDDLDLQRLRKTDASAQTKVFRQFEKPVYTLCFRMLGSTASALDAMQDSFVQAFTRIGDFKSSAPFGFWLRKITLHRCLRELRDRKDQAPSLLLEDIEDQSHTILQLTDSLDLEHALAQLSDRARAVLWLYHVEGYQHAEIAELFGQSLSFSKSQLARALTQMRQFLQRSSTQTHPAMVSPL